MELYQYFRGTLRWWWLILLSTGIAAVASYYASSQLPRVYRASTTLIVGQVIQQANPTSQDFSTVQQLAQSYAQIAVRQPVLQATIDSLGLETSWQSLKGRVNVQPIYGTQLLVINVLDNSPQRATVIADEIAHQLILQSPTTPENQQRLERDQFVQSELDDLEQRIQTTRTRLKELRTELANALSAHEIRDLQTEIDSLEGLINTWQGNYAELLRFLEGGDSPNYLTVIEPAQIPSAPISPNVKNNVLLAAAVVVVLAFGTALLLEYIDDTIKSPDDLSKSLGLTVLASVSKLANKDYRDVLITDENSFSPLAEDYRRMRSNIKHMTTDQPPKSILVTSPDPSAGKSVTAANLAMMMAQANYKTIIVDADLRRPVIHKIFGVPNSAGLTNLLRTPELEINGQLKNTEIENLQVLTSGPLPSNPSEMLDSEQLAQLRQRLEEMADMIIFDSPPALAVTDAAVLASQVDGVILVTRVGHTRRDAAQETVKSLHQIRANVLGGVLNGYRRKQRSDYYYNHYYASNEHEPDSESFHSEQHHRRPRLNLLKR
jgi:succinoglycan biosynthesis transport protein ExoP